MTALADDVLPSDSILPSDEDSVLPSDTQLPSERATITPDLARDIQNQKQAISTRELGGDIEPTTDFEAATGGGLSGLVPRAIGAVQENVLEPVAAALINSYTAPERLVGLNVPKIESGKPLIPDEMLPLAKEQGVIPALTRTVQGLSTPANVAMLPLAAESKLIQGAYLTGAATSIPEGIEKFASAQSPDEQKDAATELGLSVAMTALMGKGLKEEPKPSLADLQSLESTIKGNQLKMPEGGNENVPEKYLNQETKTPQIEPQAQETPVKSDSERYKELTEQVMSDLSERKFPAPEVTKEIEEIKNRNGGMPPTETASVAGEEITPKLDEPVNENTTGIAHRVSESQGMAAERGEGIGAEESVEKGRELLSKGADPEKVVNDFNNDPNKSISANGMAIVRAQDEALGKARATAQEKFGEDSPEERAAWDAQKAWKQKIKPMQTEWHKQGMAQQGETEIDTGTFHGLREAYFQSSGKDFTPEQATKAKSIAKEAQKADKEVETSKKNLFEQLQKEPEFEPKKKLSTKIIEQLDKQAQEALKRIKSRTGRLSSGLDPTDLADHAIYGAAKIAKGVVKFADWSREMIKDLGVYVKPHLKQIWDESKKKLSQQDITKQIWNAAKSYLDKGETDFDNIRHKLAADFGISVKEVTQHLAAPKGAKRLTDEMYRKMAERRRITNQAKDWVNNAKYPSWLRFIRNVPRAFFAAKVFGHGTVGMITHAGNQMFNPLAVKSYWTNFLRQFKLMGLHDKGAFHEQMMQDLIRDDNFIKAKRAGLANDPFKYQDDYQNQFIIKFFHKIGLMGNRGFDALKLFRQDRFNQRWESLPEELQTPEMAKLLADIGNHETGVVKSRMGGESGNWLLFAPKLEGSRWLFLIGDPAKASKILLNWKNESPEAQEYARKEITQKAIIAGTYLGALAINQGFLSATGSNQKINFTNPKRGDWLSFKIAGHNLGIISPMIGAVRFLANIAHDSMGKRSNFEKLTPRYEAISGDVGQYARTKLSPFSRTVTDVASQSDFMGRPLPFSSDKTPKFVREQGLGKYTYPEYISETALPIPFEEAVREVWRHQGMGEHDIKMYLNALAIAGTMGTTGARLSEDTHTTNK